MHAVQRCPRVILADCCRRCWHEAAGGSERIRCALWKCELRAVSVAFSDIAQGLVQVASVVFAMPAVSDAVSHDDVLVRSALWRRRRNWGWWGRCLFAFSAFPTGGASAYAAHSIAFCPVQTIQGPELIPADSVVVVVHMRRRVMPAAGLYCIRCTLWICELRAVSVAFSNSRHGLVQVASIFFAMPTVSDAVSHDDVLVRSALWRRGRSCRVGGTCGGLGGGGGRPRLTAGRFGRRAPSCRRPAAPAGVGQVYPVWWRRWRQDAAATCRKHDRRCMLAPTCVAVPHNLRVGVHVRPAISAIAEAPLAMADKILSILLRPSPLSYRNN